MIAVVVPWQMSAGADWSLLLTLLPILAFTFYLERRPPQRRVIAVLGIVLMAGMALFADGDLVIPDPCLACAQFEPWSVAWVLAGCWWC